MPAQKLEPQVNQAVVALLYASVMLIVLEYVFFPPRVEVWLNGPPRFFQSLSVSLNAGIVWSLGCFTGYLLLPLLIAIFANKRTAAEIGYSLAGFRAHVKTYLWLYAAMAPLIFAASRMASFQQVYPFVAEAKSSLPKFLIWELFYVLQFISLEAFFRGYLLFTLARATHDHVAIAMMTVPYAMIHFHKPMPEALGAVAAGVILGWLALKYRSWAGGALLHSLVAVTMDTIAAARAGLF
jgi:membrane protease YdiL (CAAX protease family)